MKDEVEDGVLHSKLVKCMHKFLIKIPQKNKQRNSGLKTSIPHSPQDTTWLLKKEYMISYIRDKEEKVSTKRAYLSLQICIHQKIKESTNLEVMNAKLPF